MYLSDRDLELAIDDGRLIVDPPTKIGPTSIDLHLDLVQEARVWDTEKLSRHNREHGLSDLELSIARCNYGKMSELYLKQPPTEQDASKELDCKVFRRDDAIIVKPYGFVLWQTKECVGTPEESPEFICFIDGKSTRARTGLVVHLTAPTIHAGWSGKVTLEIANLGPLHLVLKENDVIAQITVAKITSPPLESMKQAGSVTQGQTNVGGATLAS
jgi:dCTP deaminase